MEHGVAYIPIAEARGFTPLLGNGREADEKIYRFLQSPGKYRRKLQAEQRCSTAPYQVGGRLLRQNSTVPNVRNDRQFSRSVRILRTKIFAGRYCSGKTEGFSTELPSLWRKGYYGVFAGRV